MCAVYADDGEKGARGPRLHRCPYVVSRHRHGCFHALCCAPDGFRIDGGCLGGRKAAAVLRAGAVVSWVAVKHCAAPMASRYYLLVKKTTDITTMVMLAVMAVVYGKDFIGAIGSYAIGTLILFVGVVTLATDRLGFGLEQGQRSVLTIGMCTRNLGAAIAPLMAIKADSRSVVMVALGIPVTLAFSFLAARWYASHAPLDGPVGR